MKVGDRIKELRKNKDMSQVELADAVGVSKQTMYKYENNIITNIPSDVIERIAKILNVSEAYLMGWEPEPTSPGMAILLEEYRNKLFVDEIMGYIEKLNDAGKAEAVQRVKELTFIPRYVAVAEPVLNAAHERTDIEVTEEMKKHDDDIMADDDF